MGPAVTKVSSRRRGSNKNTSVRKRTQPTLSKEYQTVFETTGKAMVIIEEDATISLVNAEFEKLSGFTKKEIEGKKSWTEFVARNDRKRVKEYHLLRRTDPMLAPRSFEFRFLDRQEKVKNIILTIGQIPGANKSMASLLDITDRRQAEETVQDKKSLEDRVETQTAELVKTNEALRAEIADLKREVERLQQNETHNRMLMDNIDLSINLIDSDYTIVKVNAAATKQTNKPVRELIGKKCFREFEKRDAVCPHCPGVQTMATGKLTEVEAEGVRDDGNHYLVRIQTFPVFGHDRTITGFIEIVEDITERKRIEDDLQETDERFRTLVATMKVGLSAINAKGIHTYINDHLSEMLGYSANEIMGHPVIDFLDEENRKIYKKQLSRLRKGERESFEITWTGKDGRGVPTILAPTPILDAEGRYKGMYGFITDITERRRAEELLQQEKETFYTILQHALYAVVLVDRDGKHLYVNPEFTAITGYTLEDIPTGKDWLLKAYPDKKYRQEVTELWRKDSKLGGTKRVVSIVCKNGETKEIEFRTTVLDDGRTVAMLVDITERKRMEEELRASEQHYRTLFKESLDGICLADAETGIIIDCNKALADMVYREQADLIGKPQTILHPPQDDQEKFSLTFKQHLTDKEGQIIETQLITRTGDIREVEIKANSMNFQGRKLLQGVFRDITERKQAEKLLQQEKDTFLTILQNALYGVALMEADGKHVYVNPEFTAISGYTLEDIPTGKDWMHKAYPDEKYRQEVTKCWRKDSKLGGTKRVVSINCKNGETKEIEASRTPLNNGLSVVMLSDITERKRMEKELRASEERFKMLAEHAPLGISIMAPDRSFEYLNPQFTKIFGYTRKDIPNKDIWFKKAYPDKAYRNKVISSWKRDTAEGSRIGEENPRIFTVRCKDGQDKVIDFRRADLIDGKQYQVYEDITARAKAEEDLRESEERFRLLVDHSKDGFFLHEYGRIIDLNQHACDSLGYTREELLNLSIQDVEADFVAGEHQEKWKQMVPGVPITVEGTHRRKDGTTFPIEVRLVSFESGGRKLMLGLVRDVTERKQMEEELRESEERFRNLVETMKAGLTSINEKGVLTYANEQFCTLLGYSRDDLIGHPTVDFYYDGETRKLQKKVFAKRRKGILDLTPYEIAWRRKDGKKVYTIISPTPRFDADGRYIGSSAIQTDITERKQMEEELRTSRMHLADAMDMARIAYWEADHQAKEFILNDAFYDLYGTTAEAEGGYRMSFEKFVQRYIHPDDEAIFGQVNEDIEKSTDQEQTLYHEHRFVHRNGEIHHVGVRSRVFRDASGNVKRTFGANQDITERKKVEDQLKRYAAELEQSNEEVRNFAYIVSHDLRVPLVNLKGYSAELHSALEVIGSNFNAVLPHLNEDKRSAVAMALHEDAPEALEFITNSVSRMDNFINSVLILSRLGRRELKPEPLDMNALVQASLETLSHQIQERGTTVTIGSLPQVVADKTAMEQIMSNILGNAVKYLDPERPGRIEVTAETNNGEQIFRIRDNGRGIAEEDMHKVFAPFRRAGKQDTPGEGMGLAYVQTLVRRQEGCIWCESELGKGTTFTFTISHHRAEGGNHVAH